MARLIFLTALLIGAAAPASAGTPTEKAALDARNREIVLSEYPARALAAGEQGAVGFRVTLDRDGYASACEVTHSSGYPKLDQETCQLILRRATFKGIKDGDGRKVSAVHQGVVNWKLPGAAPGPAPAATAATMAAAAKPEKKICRRRVKTGSLADYERLCATAADWDRMAERTRAEWGALQGVLGNTRGN
ncbi:MAG TPA: energy transducer TonB [Allosphingosinicella sp.]|jgi:TonB family protein